jgi:hypothetical protein
LKVHAVAYSDALSIGIFNVGRSSVWVEHVILGGTRTGWYGRDIRQALDLPQRVEPGQALRWRLNPRVEPLDAMWKDVRGGWHSVWVWTGSMRRHHGEALPRQGESAATAGWMPIGWWEEWTRHIPVAVGVPTIVIASSAPALSWYAVVCLGIFVALRTVWSFGSPTGSRRRGLLHR